MLYIVATPIGNLKDITLRALDVLREVDYILCEDTRVTRKLLDRYEINPVKSPKGDHGAPKLISYHQHSKQKKIDEIVKIVKNNDVALVTDAGTPGISDPGNKLIKTLKHENIKTIPIPGPSAVTAALSVSGLPTDKFLFLGFIPHKKGRNKMIQEIVDSKRTVVFYESPYRILKTLNGLIRIATDKTEGRREKKIVVCRELTKKFETIYRGTAQEVLEKIKKDFPNGKPKGEFVVVF